jgi:perosamine synthetase
MSIPILKPSITEAEINAVTDVMRSGWLGLGPKTAEFEKAFAKQIGVKYCIGLNSCTAALHLAMASIGLEPEDEVIVTPMTFISTVHAVTYCGAKPVFGDICPDTLCLNPDDVASKITSKTRAIITVDMAGHPSDLDELIRLSEKHGLVFIEDAAHSCGAFYKEKPVGSIAPLTCFSFHAVKNLTCGEGGAITCNDDWNDKWFREMRWLGISKDTWSRTSGGESYKWKYWVNELGFKCHMNDIAAAIGLIQLQRLEELNAARRNIVDIYNQALSKLDWLRIPIERPYVKSSWHLYQVRLPNEDVRDRFTGHLATNGIDPGVHYIPSHLHPYYKKRYKSTCPVASQVWRNLVTLPIYPDLKPEEQGYIIDVIRSFKI